MNINNGSLPYLDFIPLYNKYNPKINSMKGTPSANNNPPPRPAAKYPNSADIINAGSIQIQRKSPSSIYKILMLSHTPFTHIL